MKTTLDLSDETLAEAKRVAAREGTTLKSLVEEGLRRVLAERGRRRSSFRLRRATYKGNGLSPEFATASWPTIRDEAYRERGS